MKKTHILGLLFLALLIPFTASAKKESFKEVKFEEGKTYTYEFNTTVHSEQKMMGMSILVDQLTNKVADFKVLSVDADGTAKLEVTLRKLKSESENSIAGKEKYDSEKENSKPNDAIRYEAWLVDKSYIVYVDKYGKGTKTEGWEELRNQMEEEVKFKGEQAATMKSALIGNYTEETILKQVTSIFGHVPDKKFTKGTSWKVKHKEDYLGTEVFTVSEVTDSSVQIDSKWDMTPNPKSKGQRLPNGLHTLSKMKGNSSGSITYEKGTNIVISRTVDQKLTGVQEMSGGPLGSNPMNVDGSSTTNTVITLVK